MIFIIDDDKDFAECIAKMLKVFCDEEVVVFGNVIDAIAATSEEIPKMIFLDVLLDGPDGWTFLNEMMSYGDTEKIPVVIMSSLDFADKDLSSYGIVAKLNKAEMTPVDIRRLVEEYVK